MGTLNGRACTLFAASILYLSCAEYRSTLCDTSTTPQYMARLQVHSGARKEQAGPRLCDAAEDGAHGGKGSVRVRALVKVTRQL